MKNILINEIKEGTIFGVERCTCDNWVCVQEGDYIEFENTMGEKIQFILRDNTKQFMNYSSHVIISDKNTCVDTVIIDKERKCVVPMNLFNILVDIGVAVDSMDILTDMYRGFEYLGANKKKLQLELKEYVEVCLLMTGSLKSFMDVLEYLCDSEEKMRTVMTTSWDMIMEILELNWEYEYLEEILDFRKKQK